MEKIDKLYRNKIVCIMYAITRQIGNRRTRFSILAGFKVYNKFLSICHIDIITHQGMHIQILSAIKRFDQFDDGMSLLGTFEKIACLNRFDVTYSYTSCDRTNLNNIQD